jgi:ribonucleoside-diphosphate reductase alpha chain
MGTIYVIKRNGEKELLDYDKINNVLLWACENINNVSASDVAMNARLQISDGIDTKSIHQVLIQSAANMISEKTPNYQHVASNLLNFYIRKNIFGVQDNLPHLKDVIKMNIDRDVYDEIILDKYSDEEINKLNKYIRHNRDYNFTYAGLQQLIDKYLLKDRKTGETFETPQYMYMLIAMTLLSDYEGKERLQKIKSFYNDISLFKISLPTPIMAGVRTPTRQYSSCTLIDVDDTLESIYNSNTAMGYYTAKRAGIGINIRIRSAGDKIRNGEVIHTGVIPFLKMFESTVKSCTQNGIRGGSATTYIPFWHKEIQDILVLKNNKGTDDNRVRKLDYGIQFSKIFYSRFVKNQNISLFSPADTPGLYESFGIDNDKFDELYQKYEKDTSIDKIVIPAKQLMNQLIQERIGTGRIYIMNIDNANTHSAFLDKIYMSNLCVEINLPTTPIQDINDDDDDDGEIALCVLSAINLGEVKDLSDLEGVLKNTVAGLDFVITHQDYPVKAAKKMLKRRSVGIGVTNLAYYLAKNGVDYDSPEALEIVDELMEHIQYYAIKASVELAKEFGPCEWFNRTKYSKGILPIDTYSKNVDQLVKRKPSLDWESLRKDVLKYGMRNSTLTAIMPCESSSVVTNSTNGIEPIRSLITVKKSKQGLLKMVAPEINKLKNKYQLAFDLNGNKGITRIQAVIQKWIDQGISANHYYDFTKYDEGNLPLSEVAKDLLEFYKYGGKQLYYANSNDKKTDDFSDITTNKSNEKQEEQEDIQLNKGEVFIDDDDSCASGSCSI